MLLNNQQITEQIKKEIKICIEMSENENTTTWNLWDTVKAVLRGKFIAIQVYFKKQVIILNAFQFSSVQSLSRVWIFATPWIAAHQASLSITNSQSSFKLMSIEIFP